MLSDKENIMSFDVIEGIYGIKEDVIRICFNKMDKQNYI